MSGRNHVAVLTIVSIVMCLVKVEGYEDKSHQRLSQRALQVAMANANGVPPDLLNQFVSSRGDINKLGLRVIEGAGHRASGRAVKITPLTAKSECVVCDLKSIRRRGRSYIISRAASSGPRQLTAGL